MYAEKEAIAGKYQQHMAQDSAKNAIEKPRLPQQLDQLEKALAECHSITSHVESAASRLLGAVPEDAAKTSGRPPAGSLDQRLAELIGVAEALVHRLGSASQRFNSAV